MNQKPIDQAWDAGDGQMSWGAAPSLMKQEPSPSQSKQMTLGGVSFPSWGASGAEEGGGVLTTRGPPECQSSKNIF